jgi:hypothetical protein
MLLETKRGKENKVAPPDQTANALETHTWTRDGGYQPVAYVHEEYPKMLYRKREIAEPVVVSLLNDLFGVEDSDDRQSIYLQAMQQVGESGVDIRQWPLTAPSDAMLKAMQSVLKLHARDQLRDEWLAANPSQTTADYKKWISTPDTVTVNDLREEHDKILEGWCYTPECRQVVPSAQE